VLRLVVALPGPWEETVAAAARAGAWGVGLPLGEEEAAAMGRRCREAGLVLAYVTAAAEPAAHEPERRALAAAGLRRALALGAAAGALAVVTDAGPAAPPPEDAPVPGRDPLDRAAETLRAALGEGPAGVRLVVRTAAGTAVDSLLRAAEAVRRVAHPALGVLFDPVELISLDTYHDNPSFLRRAVAQLGPVLWGCAARDVLLQPEGFGYRLREEAPGRGALDWPGLLCELGRLPRDVPLCVTHASGEPELLATLRYLREAMGAA
jgi:sugar phosphate isomerase/epimerase